MAHQRREPDRGRGVIGEDQERAAIGNEAAMQRDAVHRRRHAHARARRSGCSGRRKIVGADRLHALGDGEIGMGQIGRAAEQVRQRFARSRRAPFPTLAAWRYSAFSAAKRLRICAIASAYPQGRFLFSALKRRAAARIEPPGPLVQAPRAALPARAERRAMRQRHRPGSRRAHAASPALARVLRFPRRRAARHAPFRCPAGSARQNR